MGSAVLSIPRDTPSNAFCSSQAVNFLKGPCSWDIGLFLALIDRLIIWTLYITNNCPSPPTLRARGSSRVAFPSRWPWTLCSSGRTWHGWLGGQRCHTECRAFATWLTSECWLLPARAKRHEKDLVGSPWKVKKKKKKSPAFGEEKKPTKLNTRMALKERIKTLDDVPHLTVLSFSWDILFVSPPMVLLLFLERNSNVLSTFAL